MKIPRSEVPGIQKDGRIIKIQYYPEAVIYDYCRDLRHASVSPFFCLYWKQNKAEQSPYSCRSHTVNPQKVLMCCVHGRTNWRSTRLPAYPPLPGALYPLPGLHSYGSYVKTLHKSVPHISQGRRSSIIIVCVAIIEAIAALCLYPFCHEQVFKSPACAAVVCAGNANHVCRIRKIFAAVAGRSCTGAGWHILRGQSRLNCPFILVLCIVSCKRSNRNGRCVIYYHRGGWAVSDIGVTTHSSSASYTHR